MQLTESWRDVVPDELQDRFAWAETRNAAKILAATQPDEWGELIDVLAAFVIDLDRIVRPGGNKHLIPAELDEAFRELGWREARYEIEQTTTLAIQPYRAGGERAIRQRRTTNEYGGHKIDNVKGRAALDVEWNPKDGNLDRDLSNFRSLHEGGAIDVGVILTRLADGMQQLWLDVISRAKELDYGRAMPRWDDRLRRVPANPLGTATTSNFERLVTRLERGDGGGCPQLAIGITRDCVLLPKDLDGGLLALASEVEAGQEPTRLAHRMGLISDGRELDEKSDDEEEVDLF